MALSSYDVAVVGAGPAGSAAALAVAQRGLSVLLLDRRSEVGRPVQCAEYVPRLIQREVALPGGCVAQSVAVLRTYLPGGETRAMAAPGFVLHRALFDKHLAVKAARAGADVVLRATALERTRRGLVIRVGRQEREVGATVIVGADGAHSTAGRWIGRRNTAFIVAAQCELIVDAPMPETEVYFAPEYVGGYAWLFPKGDTANVGVGLALEATTSRNALTALERFLAQLEAVGKIKKAKAVAHTTGFVPVGGLVAGWAENIVLAGDAAGCAHPLTGAGILFAIISGRLAGATAAKAVRLGDLSLLAEYERHCQEALGGAIDRGLRCRRRLIDGWGDDITAFERLLRQNWVAFEGYGRGEEKETLDED